MDPISQLPPPIFWQIVSYTSSSDHLRLQEVCQAWKTLLSTELSKREEGIHKNFVDYSFSLALPSTSNRCRPDSLFYMENGKAIIDKWKFQFCAMLNRRFEACKPMKTGSYDSAWVSRSIPFDKRAIVRFMEIAKFGYAAFLQHGHAFNLIEKSFIIHHVIQKTLPIRKISNLSHGTFWCLSPENTIYRHIKDFQDDTIERVTAVQVFSTPFVNGGRRYKEQWTIFSGEDNKIVVMKKHDLNMKQVIYQHTKKISCFEAASSFSSNSTPYVVAGDVMGALMFWNFSGKETISIEEMPKIVEKGHDSEVCLLHSGATNRMASADASTVKWWEVPSGTCLVTCCQTFAGVTALHSFYEHVLIGTESGILYLWDVSTNTVKAFENCFNSPITALGVDNSHILYVGCKDGAIHYLNFQPSKEEAPLANPPAPTSQNPLEHQPVKEGMMSYVKRGAIFLFRCVTFVVWDIPVFLIKIFFHLFKYI